MPKTADRELVLTDEARLHVMTPREIVSELDRYIIGQQKAKRAVAIALRNRWRRQQVPEELRDDIVPKNILMIGPTGVGKTEIARRLARLAQAPFIKVEASKFTEVGYVGRDVESMIRDLAELSVNMVKQEAKERIQLKAKDQAEERLLDLLLPPTTRAGFGAESETTTGQGTREKMRHMLHAGKLDDREVELEVTRPATPFIEVMAPQGMEDMEQHLKEMFSNIWDGIKTALDGVLQVIVGIIDSWLKQAGTSVDTELKKIQKFFDDAWKSIQKAVDDAGKAIYASIIKPIDDAIKYLNDAGAKFDQAGRDMINGIVNGINAIGDNIKNAITKFVDDAVQSALTAIGNIKSAIENIFKLIDRAKQLVGGIFGGGGGGGNSGLGFKGTSVTTTYNTNNSYNLSLATSTSPGVVVQSFEVMKAFA